MDKRRGLDFQFKDDLLNGMLSPLLHLVKADDTLSLNIRDGYVNIYYRGGSLAKIENEGVHYYSFKFDPDYQHSQGLGLVGIDPHTVDSLAAGEWKCKDRVTAWLAQVPLLKAVMDLWLSEHPKREREFQQLVERSNNGNYATDYFICDLEFTSPSCPELRADLVALHWPSTRESRKRDNAAQLAIIEMKFADNAIKGTSGIVDHIDKLNQAILSDRVCLHDLEEEMRDIFNSRVELGLIHCHAEKHKQAREIQRISYEPLEYILLIADHDPEKSALLDALRSVQSRTNLLFDVKVAYGGFMGYGLYEPFVLPLQQCIKSLKP